MKSGENPIAKKEIFSIAIPVMLESLFITLTSIIDSEMVSGLGTAAISAIAVTNQPKYFAFCFFFAVSDIIGSIIANYMGKKDRIMANRHFITSIAFSAMGSVIIGLLVALMARPILIVCSGQEDTLEMSITYYRIVMGGMAFQVLFNNINAALRGCGYTRVTFLSNVVSGLTNICFNYLLIEGHLGFPALGIAGAAYATVIGNAVALIFGIIYMKKVNPFVSFSFCRKNRILPDLGTFKEMFSLWKHSFAENILMRVGFLFTSSITARTGSYSMSIYSVGMHLMDLNFAVGKGFQSAAVTLAGRSNGENNPEKIKMYAEKIFRLGIIFALALSAIIILFSRFYYSLFSSEEDFIRSGVISCIIIALISPIQIVKFCHTGLLQSMKKMKLTMYAAVIANTFVQPICSVAFTMILPLELWGIWLSVFVAHAVWLIASRYFYRKTIKAYG